MPYKDIEVRRVRNREYQRKHYKKKKDYYKKKARNRQNFIKSFIDRVKSIFSCKICGESRHWVLDFHHRDGKDFSLSKASRKGLGINKIKEEIRKCDVLCSNCHRDLHYKELNCG